VVTSDASLTDLLRRLRDRPDFRRHPLRALGRRVWWHLRWRLTGRLWTRTWQDGLKIALPKGGPAALIYYQGHSEPETAALVRALLAPGMAFVDVGAHIGEYTLLAARRVGESGEVHAFEPDARVHEVLVENIRLNGLERIVRSHPWAVSDADGEADLRLGAEPALSALATSSPPGAASPDGPRVRTVTLDSYVAGRRVDLVKIDVEGAEMLVVRGARRLLARPSREAPILVFECAAHNYARFGYAPSDLFGLLADAGYSLWRYDAPQGLRRQDGDPASGVTVNLVAAKDARRLPLPAEAR
jgi:FkbM family methyltransferase